MREIPRTRGLDSTLAFRADPYRFISRRCRELGSDVFRTRLLLEPTVCMTGRQAAALFYDPERFVRKDATPQRLQRTLFGVGGVQGLDGEAHLQRKALFLSIVAPDRVVVLADAVGRALRETAQRWDPRGPVVLYEAVRDVLGRAVCAWAGIPLQPAEASHRIRELAALFEDAASIGPRHWGARRARRRAERWAAGLIERVRAGQLGAPPASALARIASHREPGGALLALDVAAVELVNVLRPTIAVAVYATFAALALHEHPAYREELARGDAAAAERFAQEVRRFYPFFPAVSARVRRAFEWEGLHFPEGWRVLLDLYGINHDVRLWEEPERFQPERFRAFGGDPYAFVPQGGGDPAGGHRCPGDRTAVEILKVVTTFLSRDLSYEVPKQDLRVDFRALPALPRSGFVVTNARAA